MELCQPSDNAWIDDGRGEGTIVDDDDPPTVSVSDISVAEAVGALSFDVILSDESGQPVTVEFCTEDGEASAGDDFEEVACGSPMGGVVTFAAGETGTKQATVTLIDDDLDEDEETLWLRLRPFNARLENSDWSLACEPVTAAGSENDDCAVGTIVDDDEPPFVVVSDAPPDPDAPPDEDWDLVFTVELVDADGNDAVSAKTVTVGWDVEHDTTSDADFTGPLSGTLEFDPNVPSSRREQTIVLQTDDDDLDEEDETLGLRLSVGPDANAQLRTTSPPCSAGAYDDDCGVGTIVDDDGPPYVVVSDASNDEDEKLVFTVELVDAGRNEAVSAKTVTVGYRVEHVTTSDADFTGPLSGTLVFDPSVPSSRREQTIVLQTFDDDLDEIDETLRLWLSADANVQLFSTGDCSDVMPNSCGEGTIVDNDVTEVRFIDTCTDTNLDPDEVLDACAPEAEEAMVFTIGLFDPDTDQPVEAAVEIEIPYETRLLSGVRGAQSADFIVPPAGATATIQANGSTTTITLDIVDEAIYEHDETLQLRLTAPDLASLPDPRATGAILNDDGMPTLSVPDAGATEGDVLAFVMELSGPIGRSVSVDYATAHGSATGGTLCTADPVPDYVSVPATTVTFDPQPAPDGTVPDSISSTVEVTTCDDGLDEDDPGDTADDETLTLRLSNWDDIAASATGATPCEAGLPGDDCAVGTVTDNDPEPKLVVAGGGCAGDPSVDVCATEGSPLSFTARLVDNNGDPAPSGRTVEVTYATGGGTATVGFGDDPCGADPPPDYGGTPPGGTVLIFDPDDSTPAEETIEVATCQDVVDEEDQTFTLRAVSATNADVDPARGSADAKIIDDDPEPVVRIVQDEVSAKEDEDLVFNIRLVAADNQDGPAVSSERDVSVHYYTVGGTSNFSAVPGVDYEPPLPRSQPGELNFRPGDKEHAVSVHAKTDDLTEDDERFQLWLSAPDNAYLDDGKSAVGKIERQCINPSEDTDDPQLQLSFEQDTVTVDEGAGDLVFTVRIINGSFCEDHWIRHYLRRGTATGNDFQYFSGVTRVAALATSHEVRVTIFDDPIYEGGTGTFEDFTYHANWGSELPSQYQGLDDIVATGRIEDNDDPPVLAFVDGCTDDDDPGDSVDACGPEDGDVVFTVGLVGATSLPAVVQYYTRGLTADPGVDYEDRPEDPPESRHTLTIGPAESSGAIRVAALDDGAEDSGETFQLWIANPDHADIVDGLAVGRIDEPCIDPTVEGVSPPALVVSSPAVSVTEGSTAAVTVTSTHPLCKTVRLAIRARAGTAGIYDAWSTRGGVVLPVIPAGTTTKVAAASTLDDDIYEGDETFTLLINWHFDPSDIEPLASQYGQVQDIEVEVTILDDDSPPLVSASDAGPVPEAEDLVFTVSLDKPSALPVEVTYQTNDLTGAGAALAGQDYVEVAPAVLDLPATATDLSANRILGGKVIYDVVPASMSVSVETLTDTVPEGHERLQFELSAPGNADIDPDGRLSLGQILGDCADLADSGGGPPPVEFSPLRVSESAGIVEYELRVGCVDVDTASWGLTFSRGTGQSPATLIAGPVGDDYDFAEGSNADMAVSSRTVATAGLEPSQIFGSMAINDDDTHEGDETVQLRVHWNGDVPPQWGSGEWFFTVTIVEDDPVPLVSVADAAAIEDGGNDTNGELAFTVSLDRPSTSAVTVDYQTQERLYLGDGAALEGSDCTSDRDFIHASDILTFDPLDTQRTVRVTLCYDDDVEESEQFAIRLYEPDNAQLGNYIGTGTIFDNDECINPSVDDPPQWSVATGFPDDHRFSQYGAALEGQFMIFGIEIDRPLCANTTYRIGAVVRDTDPPGQVVWEVRDDVTGCVGDETFETEGTAGLTDFGYCYGGDSAYGFFAGETKDTFLWRSNDDSEIETPETFTVRVTWTDADRCWFCFGAADVRDDWLDERLLFTATILDDDDPNVTVANVEAVEAAEDAGEMVFVLDLDPPPEEVAEVSYRTAATPAQRERAATRDVDYAHTEGVLTIPVGAGRATIPVAIHDDSLEELDETFLLRLQAVSGLIMADPSARGTILDDDAPLPGLSVSAGDGVFEGETVTFTVALDEESSRVVTVEHLTVDGTAVAGADYTAVPRTTLTFQPGETVKTVAVSTLTGGGAEDTEQFGLRLENESEAQVAAGGRVAMGTIYDLERPPQAGLSVADASAEEGSQLEFAVTVDPPSLSEVTLPFSTLDGSATAGSGDYTAIASGSLRIPPRERLGTISVQTHKDSDTAEGDETMQLSLGTAVNATGPDRAPTGTIADGPAIDAPEVSVSNAANDADEGDELVFTVSISPAPQSAVTVQWRTADITATAGSGDYTAVPDGAVVLAAGETAATITVQTLADAERELDETLQVELVRVVSGDAAITGRSGVGTIIGELVTISVVDGQADEEDDSDRAHDILGGHLEVRLDRAASVPLGFRLVVHSEMLLHSYLAAAQLGDFILRNGCLFIPAGETVGRCEVVTDDDLRYEGTETAGVELVLGAYLAWDDGLVYIPAEDYAVIGDGLATLTVTEDEAPPVISATNAEIAEGLELNLDVTLSGSISDRTVAVTWATEDGTATAGHDYVAGGGNLTFAPADSVNPTGVRSQQITIPIRSDTLNEGDEEFYVRLSRPTHATLDGDTDNNGEVLITVKITDDDETCIDTTQPPDTVNPPQIALDAPASITEGATATITVTVMSPAFCEPKTLGFVTSVHTSPPSPHQTPLADLADVTGGIIQGGIGIPGPTGGTAYRTYRIVDDDVSEGTEYFYFTIVFCGAYNSCTLKSNSRFSFHPDWSTLPPFTATIAIEDNDNGVRRDRPRRRGGRRRGRDAGVHGEPRPPQQPHRHRRLPVH